MATKPATVNVVVTLTQVKETPGTFVFADETPGVAVNRVYVRKDAFPGGKAPKTITLTVSA